MLSLDTAFRILKYETHLCLLRPLFNRQSDLLKGRLVPVVVTAAELVPFRLHLLSFFLLRIMINNVTPKGEMRFKLYKKQTQLKFIVQFFETGRWQDSKMVNE